jgi:hypothetical protein
MDDALRRLRELAYYIDTPSGLSKPELVDLAVPLPAQIKPLESPGKGLPEHPGKRKGYVSLPWWLFIIIITLSIYAGVILYANWG